MLEKISENYTSSESYFDITREVHLFLAFFFFILRKIILQLINFTKKKRSKRENSINS